MPFFSIIIPCYNSEKYVHKCIQSIAKQTFKDFEAIFIDDCSQDQTISKIKLLKKKNFYIYKLKKNSGPAAARNYGIKKSSGKYICFLDSDDWWLPQKLQIINNYIKKNSHEIFCHNEFLYINNKKKGKLNYQIHGDNYYEHLLLNNNQLSTSATTIKKKFIISQKAYFNESKKFFSVEDYDYWLNLTSKGARIKYIKNYLGAYNIHKTNISNDYVHNKNLLNVVFKHSFYVQKISLDKNKIWKIAKFRFELNLIKIIFLKNKYYISYFIKIFLLFIDSPIIFIKYLLKKLFSY